VGNRHATDEHALSQGTRSMRRRKQAACIIKDEQCLELRAAGKTLDEIAAAVGYANRSGAYKAVNRAMARAHGRIADMATEYRQLHNVRIERAIALIDADLNPPKLGELMDDPTQNPELLDQLKARQARALSLLRVFLERQAKLLGLDMPAAVDLNVRDMTREQELAAIWHTIESEDAQPAAATVVDSAPLGISTNLGEKEQDNG